jgi:hypothetical protein
MARNLDAASQSLRYAKLNDGRSIGEIFNVRSEEKNWELAATDRNWVGKR